MQAITAEENVLRRKGRAEAVIVEVAWGRVVLKTGPPTVTLLGGKRKVYQATRSGGALLGNGRQPCARWLSERCERSGRARRIASRPRAKCRCPTRHRSRRVTRIVE